MEHQVCTRFPKANLKAKQQGIALIQVLLISTIISILALRFTFTAREQIKTATAFEQRIKVTQAIKSTQHRMIYTLLTQNNTDKVADVFPETEPWNFYGQPFYLQNNEQSKIQAVIQNSNGLLSQRFIDSKLWTRVFQNMGYSDEQIKQKKGEITDWQDSDSDSWVLGNNENMSLANGQSYRNQAIQLPQEIDNFFEQEPQKLNTLKQISTHYGIIGLNLMHSPETLIHLFLEPELASELIKQREQNQLTKTQVMDMLGNDYDEEIMSFFLPTRFRITIQVTLGEVQMQETIEIKFQPRKKEPVLILARY